MVEDFNKMKDILEVYEKLRININNLNENAQLIPKYTKYNYEEKSFLSTNSYAKI